MSRPVLLRFAAIALLVAVLPLAMARPGWPTLGDGAATHYLMALSLAHDRDLEVEPRDLARLPLAEVSAPLPLPSLTLLSHDGWRSARFGKPPLYAALAAPLVAGFGPAGFILLNLGLLLVAVALGARSLARHNPADVALLFAASFFVLGSTLLFAYRIAPQVLHVALASIALSLGLGAGPGPATEPGRRREEGHGLLSGAALGLGVFELPLLLALAPGIVVSMLPRPRRAALLPFAAGLLAALAASALASRALTGACTPYLGVSRLALTVADPTRLPIEPLATEPGVVPPITGSWGWIGRGADLAPGRLFSDAGFLLFGRQVGLLAYNPVALLALVLVLLQRRWRPWRLVLAGGLALAAAALLVLVPEGWHGGPRAVANPVLAGLLPGALFLVRRVAPLRLVLPAGALAAIFVAPALGTSFADAVPRWPYAHIDRLPWRWLPCEWPLLSRIEGYERRPIQGADLLSRAGALSDAGEGLRVAAGPPVEVWMLGDGNLADAVVELAAPSICGQVAVALDGASESVDFGPGEGDAARRVVLVPLGPPRRYRIGVARLEARRLVIRASSVVTPGHGLTLTYAGTREALQADVYALEWREPVVPLRVPAGQPFLIYSRLTNRSAHPWPVQGAFSVYLSYHWLGADGGVVEWNGRRTSPGRDVAPGATIAIEQRIDAPAEGGCYTLVLDPVYERVAWFSERGAEAYRVEVDVVDEALVPSPSDAAGRPPPAKWKGIGEPDQEGNDGS